MSLELPPVLRFLNTLLLPKEQRQQDIELQLNEAKEHIRKKCEMMKSQEKKTYLNNVLVTVENVESRADGLGHEERKFLSSLRQFVIDAGAYKERKKILKLFKSTEAFEFFMETLYEFNATDSKGNLRDTYQPIFDAIRKSEEYKKNIFVFRMKLKDYVEALNEYFSVQMNRTNLSTGEDRIDEISRFCKERYLPNKSE